MPPELPPGGSPGERTERRREMRGEQDAGITQILNGVRETHRQYVGNDEFIDLFRRRTAEEIRRLQTLMPGFQTPRGGLSLGIIAEVQATDWADQEMQRRAAERESKIDPLTGLPNRRGFEEQFATMAAHARRSDEPLAVVMVDGDRFKQVNDTLGHASGDEVIKGIAAVLQGSLRDADVVARLGGEEFIIALSGTNPEEAKQVIERIRTSMRPALIERLLDPQRSAADIAKARAAIEDRDEPLALTASFGIADGLEGDQEAVVNNADTALYVAKRTRDTVIGPQEMMRLADTQPLTLAAIRRAQAEAKAQKEAAESVEPQEPTQWMIDPTEQ